MKKILCIVQLPPPIHGASMMNNYIVNSKMIQADFTMEIVNLQFSESIHELKKFSFSKVFKAIAFSSAILKKINTFKPDIIYFNLTPTGFAFYRDAFYILLMKQYHTNIILHLHTKGIKDKVKNSFLNKRIYSKVLKNTHPICLSKSLAGDISDVYHGSYSIVPNGIPELNLPSQNLEDRKKVPRILFLSNFIESKGILILIEAIKILKEDGFKFDVRLVGAPADISVEMLRTILTDKDLASSIEIVGPLYNNEKFIEYQNADIFVLPTFSEAFPLVILEALQFSIPVISTFEGGIPEMIINNESGLLVEKKNVQMLTEKIALLLSDKKLRTQIGENGYKRFKEYFTLEHFEANMSHVFKTQKN
jgi:glycosyltransferase involved in cell wall biosynthesis